MLYLVLTLSAGKYDNVQDNLYGVAAAAGEYAGEAARGRNAYHEELQANNLTQWSI